MRGKALQDALEWSKDKSLSYQDRQFLAASRQKEIEEEIAAQEKEAQLERERRDNEAVKQRAQLLAEANKKTQRLIRNGILVIISSLLFAGFFAKKAYDFEQKASHYKKEIEKGQEYLKLGQELVNLKDDKIPKQKRHDFDENQEKFSQEGEPLKTLDNNLKLALLNMALAVANQEKDFRKAQAALEKAENYLNNSSIETTSNDRQKLEILILAKKTRGSLSQRKDKNKGKEYYKEAFNLIDSNQINQFDKINKLNIISNEGVKAIHINLISLLSNSGSDTNLKNKVNQSLEKLHNDETKYYYSELEKQLEKERWEKADKITTKLVYHIAGVEEDKLNTTSIKNLQHFCSNLQKIDKLWVERSKGSYGFSVQKRWYEQSSHSEIRTALEKGEQVKDYATSNRDILSAFIPPAIAVGNPPPYPYLGLKYDEDNAILNVCPF
ncbi:GUN4 domain-containing protein [Scytonema sp. PRP1]|uniref:GUN4 domain-containing protein n=1 Tax=Scytonema sp. PRP1 TaxID=3120513 RepID=UPI00300CA0EB